MKKTILGMLLVSASAGAMAAGNHGPAGCGLGTHVIFKDANEWHEHVLAATTNGTSGNQTFGMTSGTLGCQDANGPLSAGVDRFLDENLEQVASDSARGEGEMLDALAELIGVEAEDESAFRAAMQRHFDVIFPSAETTSGDSYQAIVAIMSSDERLAKYVG